MNTKSDPSYLRLFLFYCLIFYGQSQSILPELDQGFLISLDNATRIEIDSSNLVYMLELDWTQSFDLLRDQLQPDNEYYIYNFNKVADMSTPFLPNSTYNHSEYGKIWSQNLTNSKNEIKLPTIPMLISNCSSVMVVDYQDETLLIDREQQTCIKNITTLLTLNEVTTHEKALDNRKIARLVRTLSLHWNEKGHIVFIKVPGEVINTVTDYAEIQSIQIGNITVYHTTDKELKALFFWVLHTGQSLSLQEMMELSRSLLPEYFSQSENKEIHIRDKISFKRDLEDFYRFYSTSLARVKAKFRTLFTSDTDLDHKLMHIFEVEELTLLIQKLVQFLDEIQVGSYEIMNFKMTIQTKLRVLELVEDIESLLEKKAHDSKWNVEVNKNGSFLYQYKFTIISSLACCIYFYLLLQKRIKEQSKKLV